VIVRILGEGQYRLDDSAQGKLGSLDTKLGSAVERDDTEAFGEALNGALRVVRETGTLVPADTLEPSDLILPHEGASLDEVRKLLAEDGIILN
jgi:hypothetical protein